MYIPESFRIVEEPEIEAFLQRYGFATMVSPAPETLIATHVPVVVKRDGPRLVAHGHVAKANAHWKSMDGTIDSLVISVGAGASQLSARLGGFEILGARCEELLLEKNQTVA